MRQHNSHVFPYRSHFLSEVHYFGVQRGYVLCVGLHLLFALISFESSFLVIHWTEKCLHFGRGVGFEKCGLINSHYSFNYNEPSFF